MRATTVISCRGGRKGLSVITLMTEEYLNRASGNREKKFLVGNDAFKLNMSMIQFLNLKVASQKMSLFYHKQGLYTYLHLKVSQSVQYHSFFAILLLLL